jgi:SAM-dependent methyltransferase
LSSPPRFVDLSPQERQAANDAWWSEHPMTYMPDGTQLAPGSKPWFDEIDRRFLDTAYYARGNGAPFGRYLTPEIAAGRRVLEVGCGMGTHAAMLIRAGAAYTGVDLTERAIEMTRRRLEVFALEGEVQQADAERLPFEDANFDSVWSWGVIHHSSSFDRCFAEIERVLKPGGRLMLMVYHHPSLFYFLYCVLARGIIRGELRHSSAEDIYLDQMDGAYARRFGRAELASFFEANFHTPEFEVVSQKEDLYPLPRSDFKRRLVNATPDALARAIFSRLGHMVVARAVRR